MPPPLAATAKRATGPFEKCVRVARVGSIYDFTNEMLRVNQILPAIAFAAQVQRSDEPAISRCRHRDVSGCGHSPFEYANTGAAAPHAQNESGCRLRRVLVAGKRQLPRVDGSRTPLASTPGRTIPQPPKLG